MTSNLIKVKIKVKIWCFFVQKSSSQNKTNLCTWLFVSGLCLNDFQTFNQIQFQGNIRSKNTLLFFPPPSLSLSLLFIQELKWPLLNRFLKWLEIILNFLSRQISCVVLYLKQKTFVWDVDAHWTSFSVIFYVIWLQ